MNNSYQHVLNQYKKIDIKTQVESASPHELVNLLFQGARKHIATAQGAMARKQISQKAEHISKALSIIAGLKSSLNHEQDNEMSRNLLRSCLVKH